MSVTADTLWRAKTILKRGGVRETEDSTEYHKHFLVTQRSGLETDVWRSRYHDGAWLWSCNAIHKDWGCVFFSGDRREPFCSHTMACKLFMEVE